MILRGLQFFVAIRIIFCILPSDPEMRVPTDICTRTAPRFDIASANMPPLRGWICAGKASWAVAIKKTQHAASLLVHQSNFAFLHLISHVL
jgi:hypothetical protein